MKRIVLGASVVCMVLTLGQAGELTRIDEGKAKSLFVEYLKATGKTEKAINTISLTPFGRSTWVIHCYANGLEPQHSWRHVMNSRGEVMELTLDSMNVVFRNEYPSSPQENDRKTLIEAFTKLHSGESVSIISRLSDIPGYDKTPLDPDIAPAVRGPFSFGKLTTVVYTYQQIGGIVRRYRFAFDDGATFRKAECIIVGHGIGDAQYYE
jgi:hypothetical protein